MRNFRQLSQQHYSRVFSSEKDTTFSIFHAFLPPNIKMNNSRSATPFLSRLPSPGVAAGYLSYTQLD